MAVVKVRDPADPTGATWIALPSTGATGPTGPPAPLPPPVAATPATLSANWSGTVTYHVGASSVTVIANGVSHAGNIGATAWIKVCSTPAGVPPPPSTIYVQTITHDSTHTPSEVMIMQVRADGIYGMPWANHPGDYLAGRLINFATTWTI